ncbi:MAG: tail fiber protein [Pseudomonadota bacterium]
MSEPFLAEIMIVGFSFAPRGWSFCDGQILPITQNQSLFSLLGTTYGGDGETSFGLPDLRGRAPVHPDTIGLGTKTGEEAVALTAAQMSVHDHGGRRSSTLANTGSPAGALHAQQTAGSHVYGPIEAATTVALDSAGTSSTGAGVPHENMQPFTTLNFIIAVQGTFPSRN